MWLRPGLPQTGVESMKWYQNLYAGKTYQKDIRKIIHQVESGKTVPDLRLILLRCDIDNHQLEIVSQDFLEKYFTDREALLIIGIASGEAEAMELLVQITDTVYRRAGTAELRSYFLGETGCFILH
ncbi:MAG: hypothetical protein LUF30_11180 [Lachnospiraceae bacterium]|nr:hypothetical protein [Lachnospiraceae bacterium]